MNVFLPDTAIPKQNLSPRQITQLINKAHPNPTSKALETLHRPAIFIR